MSLSVLGLSGTGCGSQPPPSAPLATTNRSTSNRKLLDYAPSAGLRWLVVGSPSRLSGDADIAEHLALVIPPERLDAFAESTGLRLDRLPEAAIAGYGLGTLYLAELAGTDTSLVRSLFSAKLVEGGVARNRQGLHRIVGTTASGGVRALVTVDDRHLAFASEDATLARVVEAYAENRLRSPTVLHGAGLRELPPLGRETLLAFLAPGPFSDEWGGAAGGVVAEAHAMSIEARKAPEGRLRATLTLVGSFQDERSALEKLEVAWQELRDSPTGRLLGVDQASAFEAKADLQRLTLAADLPVGPLARGLRDATSADVQEILELDAAPRGSPP